MMLMENLIIIKLFAMLLLPFGSVSLWPPELRIVGAVFVPLLISGSNFAQYYRLSNYGASSNAPTHRIASVIHPLTSSSPSKAGAHSSGTRSPASAQNLCSHFGCHNVVIGCQ